MPLTIIYVLGITMHGLFSTEFTPAKPYRIVVACRGDVRLVGTALSSDGQAQTAAGEVPRGPGTLPSSSPKPRTFLPSIGWPGGNDARRAVLEREADAAIIVTGAKPASRSSLRPGASW